MTWHQEAACRDVPDFTELTPEVARRTCHQCPVIDACLNDALEVDARTWHGSVAYLGTIRGGLSGKQRAKLLRARANTQARAVS